MVLFRSILTAASLLLSAFVSANVQEVTEIQGRQRDYSSSKCSKELAAIMYSPITPAHVYMDKIAAELKVQITAVLNQVSNAEYGLLSSFMQKYGVKVTINTFFATPFTFFMTEAGIGSAGSDEGRFGQTYAHLALGYDSFRYEPEVGYYFYGFVVQSSSTATAAIVIIELPATSGSFSPVGC